jgi:multimeric flavodoxin WrbA/nitrite reductase/ring-hydroxylating ferredoxin subunit
LALIRRSAIFRIILFREVVMKDYVHVMSIAELPDPSQAVVKVGNVEVAIFHRNGVVSAIGNACLHKGGPLGKGRVDNKYDGCYVTCPWHGWEYNVVTGSAPPGYADQQSVYDVKIQGEEVWISLKPVTRAKKAKHADRPLLDLEELRYSTTPTSLNVLGISTTNLNAALPRLSTSEQALENALAHASEAYGAETRLIRLRDLGFRHCEGYYSQHENACTWPCSISEMNPDDGMNDVYRALVLWADIVIVSTPIRWGNASSLYYKMAERLNCVQNQITLRDRILIKDKVAAFIITGGQDNIQQVAGQMQTFFTELGFVFPPFSFVGWSRGWVSEDMERNVAAFQKSRFIQRSIKELVQNSVWLSKQLKSTPCERVASTLPKIGDAPSRVTDEGTRYHP